MRTKALITLGLGLAMAGCGSKSGNENLNDLIKKRDKLNAQIAEMQAKGGNADAPAANLQLVSVSPAESGPFRHYLEIQGRVESDENILVTPKVPGTLVSSVKVIRGQNVSKGQVLATLDNSVLPSQLAELNNQLELAETVYEKQKALWDQKIGTEIAYIQAKNNLEAMQRRKKTLMQNISMYTMVAPISGVVDDVTIREGEVPTPGMGGIRIVNYAKSRVLADVAENYMSKVKVGNKALLEFPDINKTVESRVKTVGRAINSLNRTFLVEFELKDSRDIRPNMITVIKINDYVNENVISIPVNAVQKDEDGAFVYVAREKGKTQVAEKKPVKTGMSYKGQIEILEGLQAGDKVVTVGYQNIFDGSEIKF